MKKWFLISFLIAVAISKISAQNYFPKGAIWYYHVPSISSPSFHYTTIEAIGDSIFNGDTLTYLQGYVSCGIGQDELVKKVGQKIYKLNKCDSTFSLLYDFGANVGDTVTIYPDNCNLSGFGIDSVVYIIDSIKPININGNILNYYFITHINFGSGWSYPGNIIEGIGNTYSFYPLYGACDPSGGPLRCYEDTVIGYYNTGVYATCDTTFSVGIDEYNLPSQVKIFPNPSKGLVQIKTKLSIEKIEVYSLENKKIIETHSLLVDITNYPTGIYLLKVFSEKGVFFKKIMKE